MRTGLDFAPADDPKLRRLVQENVSWLAASDREPAGAPPPCDRSRRAEGREGQASQAVGPAGLRREYAPELRARAEPLRALRPPDYLRERWRRPGYPRRCFAGGRN